MGHLPVLLRGEFRVRVGPDPGQTFPPDAELKRDFLLYDVFEAVLAEITFHGDPHERDQWWREIGSREVEKPEEE
jgi:hypothetical protein